MKEIYFAGGCFWGTEMVFSKVPGVLKTVVGYANGSTKNPKYEDVCNNETGHRETVKAIYDEKKIKINQLLDIFFLIIDPTLKNRQGNDIGSQYQTGVYYISKEDAKDIKNYFKKKIEEIPGLAVELKELENFWDAEPYHQDYLRKNPGGYCHITKKEMDDVNDYLGNIEDEEEFNPISGGDPIGEVLTMYPEVEGFLSQLGMHCVGCGLAAGESVRHACKTHGMDINLVVQELNKIVRGESEYA